MTPSAGALHLARKLSALPEPAMRERVLLEYLEKHDLHEMVHVLNDFYAMGRRGGPPFDVALLTLGSILSRGGLDYETMARLYGCSKDAGYHALAQLFLTGQTGDREFKRPEDQLDQTLGHRKWKARSTDRNVLERLLRNPEPEVISNLLANPRITEQDVVLLAARRPADPLVQQQIFASRRWIKRYGVKRALILNPYTPSDLSLRLMSFLTRPDLRLVVTSTSLPVCLREAASQVLEGTTKEG